jgi:hypothetical protein
MLEEDSDVCTCAACNRIRAVSNAAFMLVRADASQGVRAVARELLTVVAENDQLRADVQRMIHCLDARDAELAEMEAVYGDRSGFDDLEDEDDTADAN